MAWVKIGSMEHDVSLLKLDRVVPKGKTPDSNHILAVWTGGGICLMAYAHEYKTFHNFLKSHPHPLGIPCNLWRKFPDGMTPAGYLVWEGKDELLAQSEAPRLNGNPIYRQPLPIP